MIIEVNGGVLDMPKDMGVQMSDTNPIYNDIGSMTVPMTIPATRDNMRLCGWPCALSSVDVNNPRLRCRVSCGAWQRSGLMNFESANTKNGITFNIGFDNSEAYATWRNSTLRDVAMRHGAVIEFDTMAQVMTYMLGLYASANSQSDPYAVFPIAVAKGDNGYFERLNVVSGGTLEWPDKVSRLIDGTLTEVSVPDGYGVTPFIRVWRVIEILFADLGCQVMNNPFLVDRDLSRLVILNNIADILCERHISEADMMPDCTVDAFFNALYVRFGLVFMVRDGVAKLRLLRDVVEGDVAADLLPYATDAGTIKFDAPKYVKLSAARKFESAAVAAERWDDFRRNHNRPIYHYGSGSQSSFSSSGTLVHDCDTCRWWWSVSFDDPGRIYSSSFFDWDPKTEGIEAMDLKSEDECVGLERVRVTDQQEEMLTPKHMVLPLYLAGSRHYYTVIKDSDKADDDDGDDTPLSFLMAYTRTDVSSGTIGRLCGRKLGGLPISFSNPDEARAEVSLLFEFKGGLFDRFWRRFDELARHATRSIEVNMRLPKYVLASLDMMGVYKFAGLRCLIDKLDYKLSDGTYVDAAVTLRVVQTQGDYDIDAEQSVPDVLRPMV